MMYEFHRVRVDLAERSYDIDIGAGILWPMPAASSRTAERSLTPLSSPTRTCRNRMRSKWPKVSSSESIEVSIVAVTPGEKSKSVEWPLNSGMACWNSAPIAKRSSWPSVAA